MSEKLCALKKIGGGIDETELLNVIWGYDFGAQGATVNTTLSTPYRTYEFWAKVPVQTTGAKTIFSFGGSNSAGGVISLSTTNFMIFANGSIINDTTLSLDETKSHHYAIVLGNNIVNLYVDKQLVRSYAKNATSAMKTSTSFVFGANQSAPQSENWSGGVMYKLAITQNGNEDFVL